jgi:ATP-dependent helicase HepA
VLEREFSQDLLAALLAPDDGLLTALIERGGARNEQIVAELESGRDRLLELTSFDTDAALELQGAIARAEKDPDLEMFMVDAFERGGLDVERIGTRSYAVRAGMDYHRPFPGFHGEEMGVTFDRAIGLTHPERSLLTWDHPMVRDTVDGLLDHETGNASLAVLSGASSPGLLLEALFVAEPTLALQLRADRFLPPAPIRVVLNAEGEEASLEADIVQQLQAADPAVLDMPQVQQLLPALLLRAREIAEARAPAIGARARRQMRRELDPVIARLQALSATHADTGEAAMGHAVGLVELEAAQAQMQQLDDGLLTPRVRLDGLRLILVTDD